MKKTILIFSIILIGITSGYSQSLSLYADGSILGDTVTVYGDPTSPNIEFTANLKNNTTNGAIIKVRRHEISLVETTLNYFKWVQTYSPTIDLSLESFLVASDETTPDETFICYYQPNGIVGKSLIEYTFFNINIENEEVKLVVKFDTSTDDIDENILNNTFVSDIYPNPANTLVNIDYDFPIDVNSANIKIVNVLGSVIKDKVMDVRDSKIQIDISGMESGVYFYSIFVNEEILKSNKFVVR